MDKRILWFEELGKESNDLVEKKYANLGEMSPSTKFSPTIAGG